MATSAEKIWLKRIRKEAMGQDRGVLGRGKSRMDFQLTSKKRLNSSQGKPYEANGEKSPADCSQRGLIAIWLCQRRKRHETGNSSIYFFGHFFHVPSLNRVSSGLLTSILLLAGGFLAPLAWADRALGADEKNAKIRQVGDDFEAMMLQRMQESMEKSQGLLQVGDDNPFAPSNAETIYRSMLTQMVTQKLAKERPLGVGNMVERQLRGEGGIGNRGLVKSNNGQMGRTPIRPAVQPGLSPVVKTTASSAEAPAAPQGASPGG